MKKEYEYYYNNIIKDKSLENIYNLLIRSYFVYDQGFPESINLNFEKFFKFLLDNNKISLLLYHNLIYCRNFIECNYELVLNEDLFINIENAECLKMSKIMDYIYYLIALYIKSDEELEFNFFNKFIVEMINDMDIYHYDFFETNEELDKHELMDYVFDDIKVYLLYENKKSKTLNDIIIKRQIKEDKEYHLSKNKYKD